MESFFPTYLPPQLPNILTKLPKMARTCSSTSCRSLSLSCVRLLPITMLVRELSATTRICPSPQRSTRNNLTSYEQHQTWSSWTPPNSICVWPTILSWVVQMVSTCLTSKSYENHQVLSNQVAQTNIRCTWLHPRITLLLEAEILTQLPALLRPSNTSLSKRLEIMVQTWLGQWPQKSLALHLLEVSTKRSVMIIPSMCKKLSSKSPPGTWMQIDHQW